MSVPLIAVDVNDEYSLAAALSAFSAQLEQACQKGCLQEGVAGFVSTRGQLFQHADLLAVEPIKSMLYSFDLMHYEFNELADLREQTIDGLDDPSSYVRYSQLLVFQHGLTSPSVKSTIIDICQRLVAFSQQQDDSQVLYLSEDKLFGIYLLVLLAESEPDYAYLIGAYFPEGSDDDDITLYGSGFIAYLFDRYGYHNLVLDALAACRFNGLIDAVRYNYWADKEQYAPNLLQCFLTQPERYRYYKDALYLAFERYPVNSDTFDPFAGLVSDFEELAEQYASQETYSHPLISRQQAEAGLDALTLDGMRLEDERKTLLLQLQALSEKA